MIEGEMFITDVVAYTQITGEGDASLRLMTKFGIWSIKREETMRRNWYLLTDWYMTSATTVVGIRFAGFGFGWALATRKNRLQEIRDAFSKKSFQKKRKCPT